MANVEDGQQQPEQGLKPLTRSLVDFLRKEEGPTAVEYAVMLALVIVVCIAAITTLGNSAETTGEPRDVPKPE